MEKNLALIVLPLLLLTAGCGGRGRVSSGEFTDTVYVTKEASGFRILGAEGRKSIVIESTDPWQGSEGRVERIFVARGGEEAPEGFDGQVIEDSARRVVAMSSTHVAMLDAVGRVGCVKGVSGMGYISNSHVREHEAEIADVGYGSNVDYERLMSVRPDLVMLYGVTGASPMEEKLRELGVPYMYVGEYLEESPLGKAEWMVALAAATGDWHGAAARYDSIAARYDALREAAGGVSGEERPGVMVNIPYADTWYMPSTANYMARLIADAGGRYVYTANDSRSSEPVSMEEAYLLASDADVWLNPGQLTTLGQLREALPRFSGMPSVKNGRVYNNNLRLTPDGGNDFYESGVVRPDAVLADMISIFHPEVADSLGVRMAYYRRLP